MTDFLFQFKNCRMHKKPNSLAQANLIPLLTASKTCRVQTGRGLFSKFGDFFKFSKNRFFVEREHR